MQCILFSKNSNNYKEIKYFKNIQVSYLHDNGLSHQTEKSFAKDVFPNRIFKIMKAAEWKKEKLTVISALKKQIDDLVYKLYNLTPEEIQIIESGVQ